MKKKFLKLLKICWYKFQLWRIDASFGDLDIDMMCTKMRYEEYIEEFEQLSSERLEIESKLNSLDL